MYARARVCAPIPVVGRRRVGTRAHTYVGTRTHAHSIFKYAPYIRYVRMCTYVFCIYVHVSTDRIIYVNLRFVA